MTQVALEGFAWVDGQVVPLAEARVSLATHALHYGTGCFEGIRAYYSQDDDELYVLKMPEHYRRMAESCRILRINPGLTPEEMGRATLDLLRHAGLRRDLYIRPLAYKAGLALGLGLSTVADAFAVYCVPLGAYHATQEPLHCCVSAWVRPDDNALPVRAKVTGAYINACLASDDARLNGFDEAILLTADGHVSEAASSNLFMVRGGRLVTPPVSEAILEGVTRNTVIDLAREMGYEVEERKIDRTELYTAEELFLTGTAVEIRAIGRVDHRPVAGGSEGPITRRIRETYEAAVRGRDPRYRSWLTPVFSAAPAPAQS